MKKILFLLALLPTFCVSQSVKGNFSPAEEFTYAFLYKANPNGADYIGRAKLDSLGHFEIPIDTSMTPGIYKIVYAIPPEENNFDFIYNGKEDVVVNFDLENGVDFKASMENKLWTSYQKSMDVINQTISNYYKKGGDDKDGFVDIIKTLEDAQRQYEEASKGTLAATFISSNTPYLPKGYEDISTYSQNLKAHYLKPIDFNNELLQSSTFIQDRIITYVFGFNPSDDIETYKKHIDDVAIAIKDTDNNNKAQLLYMLWNNFANIGNETIANYITDEHLLSLVQDSTPEMAQSLIAYKNTSTGQKAPDFKITYNLKTQNLSELNETDHYLLIFWSSTCGHCLKELPEIKTLIANKPNLKVIAYGIEDDKTNWEKEIKSFPDFIHVIGLDKWNNTTVKAYGVSATPTYFILDKDKTIISKPYELKDLKEVLDKL